MCPVSRFACGVRALTLMGFLWLFFFFFLQYLKKKIIPTLKHRRCLSYPEPKFFDQTSKQSNSKEIQCLSTCHPPDIADSPKIEKVKVARSNTLVINSIFKNSEDEKLKKKFIKNCSLKNSFSTSDLYLLHQKEAQRFSYLKKSKLLQRRRSFSNSSYSEDYLSGGDEKHCLSDVLEVKWVISYSDFEPTSEFCSEGVH